MNKQLVDKGQQNPSIGKNEGGNLQGTEKGKPEETPVKGGQESNEEIYKKHLGQNLEERKRKSQYYLDKYPDTVPVFIINSSKGIVLSSPKILLKKEYSVSQFIYTLKQRENRPDQTYYFYSNNRILKPTEKIIQVYEKNKDPDGFLYLKISEIPSLGSYLLN